MMARIIGAEGMVAMQAQAVLRVNRDALLQIAEARYSTRAPCPCSTIPRAARVAVQVPLLEHAATLLAYPSGHISISTQARLPTRLCHSLSPLPGNLADLSFDERTATRMFGNLQKEAASAACCVAALERVRELQQDSGLLLSRKATRVQLLVCSLIASSGEIGASGGLGNGSGNGSGNGTLGGRLYSAPARSIHPCASGWR